MVINHLLTGMILQVVSFWEDLFSGAKMLVSWRVLDRFFRRFLLRCFFGGQVNCETKHLLLLQDGPPLVIKGVKSCYNPLNCLING